MDLNIIIYQFIFETQNVKVKDEWKSYKTIIASANSDITAWSIIKIVVTGDAPIGLNTLMRQRKTISGWYVVYWPLLDY